MSEPDGQRATRRAAPFELLALEQFRRVWIAGALSGIVRWLDMLGVAIYVHQVTGSPLLVAGSFFLRMIPMLLFGALAGAFAETVNRKKLLISALLTVATVYAILFWLASTGRLEIWQLGLGVFISGFLWALEFSVRRPMLAEIGGIQRIGAVMGLESSTNNLTRALGPVTGGFLFELFQLPGTIFLTVCLLSTAALLLMTVKYGDAPMRSDKPSIITNLIEGFRFVRSNRPVAATLGITIVLNLFAFSFASMVPVIANTELGLTPFPTGILAGAEGFGAFVGALLIAFFADPRRFHQLFLGGSTVYILCIIAFALSPSFEISLPVLWLGGFGAAGFTVLQSGLAMANTPPEMRNRVMGVVAMCIGIGPFGVLFVGFLAERFGASAAVLTTASIGLVGVILCSLVWPEMRKLRDV